jgi:cellulose synthase/poly-beta-1,6-N-acetylglucosamine synthase-like glycosyltransferase
VELLFWSAVAVLGWCYAGYPLAVWLRSVLRPLPLTPAGVPLDRRVSVVVAVRNGEAHLAARLQNLLAQSDSVDELEILVVCNGCTDGSLEIAREASRTDARVRVLESPVEQGKAGALNLGVEHASEPLVAFADARQLFAADALRRLIEPFEDPAVGAVTGRLIIGRGEDRAVEGVRWYWGFETLLREAEGKTGSVVGATGAIYAIRRALYEMLPANLILDDVYLPVRIAMRGLRVVMARGAVAVDIPSPGGAVEFQRKRRTMVGNLQLLRLLPELISPRANPIFGRFLSHKLLRLATPVCLMTIAISAALLPGGFYQTVFLGAAVLYAYGAAGLFAPLPLASVASAVVMMHGAIFSAFWHFRHDAGSVWVAPLCQPVSTRELALVEPAPEAATAAAVGASRR